MTEPINEEPYTSRQDHARKFSFDLSAISDYT